jgi:DNA mismatch endonuclease (patch repair protein)
MPDIFTRQKRSDVMSRIRGTGNKDTELRLIQLFRANCLTGWRRGSKLPGRPDFVFPKFKIALFVDGCFWHGCPRHATWPKTRAAFWKEKIETNRARDRRVNRALRALGRHVLRIWEHKLKHHNEQRLVRRLLRILGRSA